MSPTPLWGNQFHIVWHPCLATAGENRAGYRTQGSNLWMRLNHTYFDQKTETLGSCTHLCEKVVWSLCWMPYLTTRMLTIQSGEGWTKCLERRHMRRHGSWKRRSCLISYQFLWARAVLSILCYCEVSLPPFDNFPLIYTGLGGLLFLGWTLIKMGPILIKFKFKWDTVTDYFSKGDISLISYTLLEPCYFSLKR